VTSEKSMELLSVARLKKKTPLKKEHNIGEKTLVRQATQEGKTF
jgi:hypothetical protein